jgi:pSer/pThr/pTyr-binding forkhead associated (FHA) protein
VNVVNRWIVGTLSSCQVRVGGDEYVSPRHCEVAQTDGGEFFVRDLGSTNGTHIQNVAGEWRKATGWTRFLRGETLIVGRSRIPWAKAAV